MGVWILDQSNEDREHGEGRDALSMWMKMVSDQQTNIDHISIIESNYCPPNYEWVNEHNSMSHYIKLNRCNIHRYASLGTNRTRERERERSNWQVDVVNHQDDDNDTHKRFSPSLRTIKYGSSQTTVARKHRKQKKKKPLSLIKQMMTKQWQTMVQRSSSEKPEVKKVAGKSIVYLPSLPLSLL